ncbi:MAG: TonB-dependent receptor [Burkholderiales bacterium]
MAFNSTRANSLVWVTTLLLASLAHAQESPTPANEPAPTQESPAATKKPDDKADKVERIEVTGTKDAASERRNSTAAKIIINREDIEQYGDTNLGDVLKRLPGVTQGGRPGRGGGVAMRGMGGGYTQILINGERNPPGFSIEQISPEQVERIEILRAPTAETGTRAVAGTINIILREPLRAKSDEFKAGVQEERGRYSPNLSWNRNDSFGETGTYNLSASLNRSDQLTDNRSSTVFTDLVTGAPILQQDGTSSADSQRNSAFVSSRVQWRLGQGELFSLQPFIVHHENHTRTLGTLAQSLGNDPVPYTASDSTSKSKVDVARLNTQLLKRLDPQSRLDARVNVGIFKNKSDSNLSQNGGAANLIEQKTADISDRSWSLNLKALHNFESGHSGVLGTEVERVNRSETGTTLQTRAGITTPLDLGGDLKASINRTALYIQDEWDPAENLSANLGVRWESIQTNSDDVLNSVSNRSSVITPVGHLVWRFASLSKDQVRLSLTQSYKPPTTQNLIARPNINNKFPLSVTNAATSADSAGNPDLKAELAKGVDLAYERYLDGGGIVSVNFFRRNITDLIRNQVNLETVDYAPVLRFVSRPQNIGDAVTQGIEFDSKFRLSDAIAYAPPVNLRLNMSLYKSNVSGVPGPYNRIDQQPRATGNFGLDYKLPATAWSVGGNLGFTPAYTTQIDDTQSTYVNARRVTDVYALWNVTPKAKLRFGLANLAPLESQSVNRITDVRPNDTPPINHLETTSNIGRSDVAASVRLEMRL